MQKNATNAQELWVTPHQRWILAQPELRLEHKTYFIQPDNCSPPLWLQQTRQQLGGPRFIESVIQRLFLFCA